jgi:hypothetical protein
MNIIEQGLQFINESSIGHLSKKIRNELLRSIEDEDIKRRISLLCALKVYPLWKSYIYNDYKVISLLIMCENYLQNKVTSSDVVKYANELVSYLQSLNDEKTFDSVLAGYTAVQAALEIANGYSNIENELDDFDLDSSDWDSAFIASLVYNGGSEDVGNINPDKNRLFWKWYLTDCLSAALDKEKILTNNYNIVKPIYNISEQPRMQINECINNGKIISSFDYLKKIFAKMLQFAKWDALIFDAYIVAEVSYDEVSYYKDGVIYDLNLSIGVLMHIDTFVRNIKNEMYENKKEEGGFYELKMKLNKNGDFVKEFNYDVRGKILQENFQGYNFVDDFQLYPRDHRFIPEWLKIILRNYKVKNI